MAAASVDSNDSDCFVCSDGGDLLCCDHCPRSFHDTCLTPALDTSDGLPDGDWACPLCSGYGQGRFDTEVVSSKMDEEEKGCVRTRGVANGVLDGSRELNGKAEVEKLDGSAALAQSMGTKKVERLDGLVSQVQANGKAKIERLDGLSSPVQGRALVGKLSPVTPAQNEEGVRTRTLRKRAGKDTAGSLEQKRVNGVSGSRKRKAKDESEVTVKKEEAVFDFQLDEGAELDLRTPEMKMERNGAGFGQDSVSSGRTRKVRLSATFKQTEGEEVASGSGGVSEEGFAEGSESNSAKVLGGIGATIGGGQTGFAQPELETDEDNPIALRVNKGKAKMGGAQAKTKNSELIAGGRLPPGAKVNGHLPGEVAQQANGASEDKKGKKRPAPRKRKNAEVENDGEAGPSGTAEQRGRQLAPAGEQSVDAADGAEVERPRNRRRNRAAPAVDAGGGAGDAPAGVDDVGGDQDQGDRARARFLAIARRRAAHFAHFAGDDHVAEEDEGDEEAEDAPPRIPRGRQVAADDSGGEEPDWPGPFSTARKLVRERGAAAAARGEHLPEDSAPRPVVDWTPSRTLDTAALFGRRPIPSLFDMSVRLLVDNAEFVESMEGIPDAVRKRVAAGFCARRKMIPETLSLFFRGSPGEIVLPDCTLVGEAEMTEAMAQTDTQRLEVLDLGMCGRCITDQGLSATFAGGVNTLPQLTTLSLRGAYRLTDAALEKLLAAAPGVTSLELRKCSLLTEDAVRMTADALWGRLTSLSLEGCAQLDGARIQPSLLRLTGLRRLNLSAVSNVTDALVQELGVTLGSGLEELRLAGASDVSDAAVAALAACCPNLALLDLDGAVKLTDVAIARLADGCRGVRHLSLRRGKFIDEALAAFVTASGSQLRHLSVNNVRKAGDATLMALAKHSRDSLTSLDVSWCRHVSDQGLGLLADSCRRLHNLRLFGCSQVTDLFLSGHSNPELVVTGQGDDVK